MKGNNARKERVNPKSGVGCKKQGLANKLQIYEQSYASTECKITLITTMTYFVGSKTGRTKIL